MEKYSRPIHPHQNTRGVKSHKAEMCDHQKDHKHRRSSSSKSQHMKHHHQNPGHRHRHYKHKSDGNESHDTHSTAEDSIFSDHHSNHRHQSDNDKTHHSDSRNYHHKQNHHHVSLSETSSGSSTNSFSSSSSSSSTSSSSSSSSSDSSSPSSSSFSSSSTTSSSSSSLSSENSSESSDGYALGKPQHSQSCTDISGKHKYFEEGDDTAPLIDKRGDLNKLPAKQKREKGKSSHGDPAKKTLKSKKRTTSSLENDGSFRKAKSMEALSTPKDREVHGNKGENEQERRKCEARKNLMKEKMKFSAFLNEITRQVLSPMRLTTLGVTDAQRPCSPGQASLRSRKGDRNTDKPRQQRSRPTSADSVSSNTHSQASQLSQSKSFHGESRYFADSSHHMHHRPRSCTDIGCFRRRHSWSQSPEHHPHSFKHYHHHHQGNHKTSSHHHHHHYHENSPSPHHHHRHHHSPVYQHEDPRSSTYFNKDHHTTSHHYHYGHHRHREPYSLTHHHSHAHHHHHDQYRDRAHHHNPTHHHEGHHSESQHHHHGDHHSPSHPHHHGDHHSPSHPHHHGDHHSPDHHQHHGDQNSPDHHHHHGDYHSPGHHHHHGKHHSPDHHHHHGEHNSPDHHHHHGDHHSPGHHHHHGEQNSPDHHHHHRNHHSPGRHHHHGDHHSPDHHHHHGDHQSPGHHHLHHGDHHSPDHHHHHGEHQSPGHQQHHRNHHSPGHHQHHGEHHSPDHHQHHSEHHSPGHHQHHGEHHSPSHHHQHGDHHSPGHYHHHGDHNSPDHHHHHGDHHSAGHHHHHGDQHTPDHHHHHGEHHNSGLNHRHGDHHSPDLHHHHGEHHNPDHHHHYDLPSSGHHHHHEDHHRDSHHHHHGDQHSPDHHHHESHLNQPLSKNSDHSHDDHHTHLKGHSVGSPPLHRKTESLSSKPESPGTTSSLSSHEEERTSFTGPSLHKEMKHEMGRIMILQEQNEGLHHTLLKTAVRMECLGEEFMSSQKLLETELQRTRMELSNLTDRFKRLHEDCSSSQQTNNALEQKLHSVTQGMEEERERLNRRISELTHQLADTKFANNAEAFSVTPAVHKNNYQFQSDDTISQVVLPIAPPPAQFMDNHNYGKVKATGQEQPLGSVPEEEESDWSEMGEETPRLILTGSNRGQTWRHQEVDLDKDNESGGEEIPRRHSPRPLQIPHLQFTSHNDNLPAPQTSSHPSGLKNLSDGMAGEGSYRSTSTNHGSSILIRSASLEEIPLACHHMQKELRGTEAMMDLHHPGNDAIEDLDNEIIHHWSTSNHREAIGRSMDNRTSETDSSLASLHSAERMLNHFICDPYSIEGREQDIVEVHGWKRGIPDEVLKGERTKL